MFHAKYIYYFSKSLRSFKDIERFVRKYCKQFTYYDVQLSNIELTNTKDMPLLKLVVSSQEPALLNSAIDKIDVAFRYL